MRVVINLRQRINKLVKGRVKHDASLEDLIGCSRDQLIRHLKKHFLPGMTWETYGKAWDVDHSKIPCAVLYSITDPTELQAQLKRVFHYKNLKPLWSEENRKQKRAKLKWRRPPDLELALAPSRFLMMRKKVA